MPAISKELQKCHIGNHSGGPEDIKHKNQGTYLQDNNEQKGLQMPILQFLPIWLSTKYDWIPTPNDFRTMPTHGNNRHLRA
jgi:hypothetical protein